MRNRAAGVGVVAATGFAAFGFTPVYTAGALVWPLAAVLLPVVIADLLGLAMREQWYGAVRPVVAVVLAIPALALAVEGPFADALRALPGAVSSGWLHTLESTWPVRPLPELVGFVALTALAAAVLGVELVHRVSAPLALLPSLVLLGLSQMFAASVGWAALGLAAGYGICCAVVLLRSVPSGMRWALPGLVMVVAAGWGTVVLDPGGQQAYSLHDQFPPPVQPTAVTNPLNEIAERLGKPDEVVFTNRTTAAVDRWPIVVLDSFDGSNWSTSATFRPLGGRLAADTLVRGPVAAHEAAIGVPPSAGPWLPVQFRPRSVTGVDALVDPTTGTMLSTVDSAVRDYTLSWDAPTIDADTLADSEIDPSVGSLDLGRVPPELVTLAHEAVGNVASSFRAALLLETWLRDNCRAATGRDRPTGHGYANLRHFLLTSKRGTSEQFATAYVVLARAVGIPARLVVGYRQPTADSRGQHVVRNADVLAWPEVAVRGLGWVPLDPISGATAANKADGSLAAATEKARKKVVDEKNTAEPESPTDPVPPPPPPPPPHPSVWPGVLGLLLGILVVGWLTGVPMGKRLRTRRRRRRPPHAAVVGAWWEARDLLRDHGVPVRAGMTVRDLRGTSPMLREARVELDGLARCVDYTLWSGLRAEPTHVEQAWSGVAAVSRVLAGRPWHARLRAKLNPRGLFPLRR
jgi:transglutaminase-like putative cysteine protease